MEGVFCQNSEWGLKLAVVTDRHKRVSIPTGSRTLTPVIYLQLGLRLGTLTIN